jgi:hypothetical protein
LGALAAIVNLSSSEFRGEGQNTEKSTTFGALAGAKIELGPNLPEPRRELLSYEQEFPAMPFYAENTAFYRSCSFTGRTHLR